MPTRPRVLAGAGVGAYPGPHCGPPHLQGHLCPSSPLHPALGPDNHLAQETGPSGSLTPREPPRPPGPCPWTRWEGPRTHPDHTWPPAPAHQSVEGPIIPQFPHLQKEHEETVKLCTYRWTPPPPQPGWTRELDPSKPRLGGGGQGGPPGRCAERAQARCGGSSLGPAQGQRPHGGPRQDGRAEGRGQGSAGLVL